MKLILGLMSFILVSMMAGCASSPNMQLDCEKKADGSPSVWQCKEYPWYVGGQCSRIK